MTTIEQIEELCGKHSLSNERNIFEEQDNDTLYIDLSDLCSPSKLKAFANEMPEDCDIYYLYAGDDAIEDWQRKLCMAIEF